MVERSVYERLERLAEEADRLSEDRDRLLGALKNMTDLAEEFLKFHDSPKKPCGEYGTECPISMGEWFAEGERHLIKDARTLIGEIRE